MQTRLLHLARRYPGTLGTVAGFAFLSGLLVIGQAHLLSQVIAGVFLHGWGYSAARPLLAWLGHFRNKPRRVFVVHGEDTVANGFAADLQQQFGWDAMAPTPGQSVVLD